MSASEAVLPADIVKEEVRQGGCPRKVPKTGDGVRIHYTGFGGADGSRFDSSVGGEPFSFRLNVGAAMEAWDRAVSTMARGEVARFTFPEMYLSGGPAEVL